MKSIVKLQHMNTPRKKEKKRKNKTKKVHFSIPIKKIGEGSYGCVHKPSLSCSDKKINYKNKISKTMKLDDLKKELDEYELIEKIDSHHYYHLQKPDNCLVDKNDENIQALKQCDDGFDFLNYLKDNKLGILIMRDGGINLMKFGEYILREQNKSDTFHPLKKIVEIFWIKALKLLLGLQLFDKNDVLHHDLKPQNIVYDYSTTEINFIDFGLMRTKNKVLTKNIEGTTRGSFHWSYPFELELYNNTKFLNFVRSNEEERMETYNQNKNEIISIGEEYFFSFDREKYLNKYKHFLLNLKENEYMKFIEKGISTIDTFGLGLSYSRVLKCTYLFLEEKTVQKLQKLFENMVNPMCYERWSIQKCIHKYKNAISELLEKHSDIVERDIVIHSFMKTQN